MRKIMFVALLVLTFSFLAVAQDAPKAEVFGGYQYTSVDFAGATRENFNGWNAALSGYFNKNVGITADFSGAYGTPVSGLDVKLHNFLFGPTFRAPMEKATPFAHVLFGASRLTGNQGLGSDNAFAWAVGGGVDANIGRNFAFRVAQFDYLGTRFDTGGAGNDNQNHFRISTGIVLKF